MGALGLYWLFLVVAVDLVRPVTNACTALSPLTLGALGLLQIGDVMEAAVLSLTADQAAAVQKFLF